MARVRAALAGVLFVAACNPILGLDEKQAREPSPGASAAAGATVDPSITGSDPAWTTDTPF